MKSSKKHSHLTPRDAYYDTRDAFSDGGSTRMPESDCFDFAPSSPSGFSTRSPCGSRPASSSRSGRGARSRPAPFSHHHGGAPCPAGPSTPPAYFTGGFDGHGSGRTGGLQAMHDHHAVHGPAWEAAEAVPPLQRAGKNAMPASHASRNAMDRAGVFEGGRQRALQRREVDGETLAESTAVVALWRPKRAFGTRPRDTALGHQRGPEFCARVEPDSRCFCGFTFLDHSAAARLGCRDGFGWKRSLGRRTDADVPGFSFTDGEVAQNTQPCSTFRYMPASPAQTTQVSSAAEAYRAARGAPVEDLHRGWSGKCRNCGNGHEAHEPETEACPLPYDAKVGSGRYESAWECAVCNQRWEDHETLRAPEMDYCDDRARAEANLKRNSRNPHGRGEPITPEGRQWGSRAAEVEQMLQENTRGISGRHRDVDHYGQGANAHRLRNDIQRENARLREVEEEVQQELARGGGLVSYVDTSSAYKDGRGAMYGFGVEDERQMHDTRRRPRSSMRSGR
eukprot:TRINITY_DN25650_c0_g1_i1.p1 TRINITY_DN25650_c0_g1~~TRINITY_DN25650_c0_g1_i1.p1  ORF type:complete len:508 (+),score=57.03 TRINITY_DN25650_c0_g1_i1:84-1607(+)